MRFTVPIRAAAAVAVVMSLATSAQPAAAGDTASPSRVTVAFIGSLQSLNPLVATSSISTRVGQLVYDRLVHRDDRDLSPVPGIAESWSSSPDGLTWTYRIAPGRRWSDGTPLTAADVAFTFNLMLRDPAARTADGNYVATFEEVTAVDAGTVRIRTRTPTATMTALDVPILPEHVWRDVADIGRHPNDRLPLVGSGPFRLVEHRPGEHLRFTANRDHHAGRPRADELVIRFFANTDAAVQALRAGAVDILGDMTPAQFHALRDEPGVIRNAARGNRRVELVYNNGAARTDGTPLGDGHPALRDPRVRLALDSVLDRAALVGRVLGGHGEAGDGYLPPMYSMYAWQPAPTERRGHDPARAERLLDEAGYRRGADGRRTRPDTGAPLALRLFTPNSRAYFAPTAEHVAGWLRALGIAVDLRVLPPQQVDEVTAKGSFDMYITGWGVEADPDPTLSIQTCGRRPDPAGTPGSTDGFYCDPTYDELYKRQVAEVDPGRRAEVVRRMQEHLYANVPISTLYFPDALEAYRGDRITGLVSRPAGGRGSVSGRWGYVSATPAGPAPVRPAADAVVGAVTLAGVTLAGVGLWWRRRGADERR